MIQENSQFKKTENVGPGNNDITAKKKQCWARALFLSHYHWSRFSKSLVALRAKALPATLSLFLPTGVIFPPPPRVKYNAQSIEL